MRQHPEMGARILEPLPQYAPIIPIVLEHHERFDGSGYPRGLAGEGISDWRAHLCRRGCLRRHVV